MNVKYEIIFQIVCLLGNNDRSFDVTSSLNRWEMMTEITIGDKSLGIDLSCLVMTREGDGAVARTVSLGSL